MKRMHILVFAISVFFTASISSILSFAGTVSTDSLAWVSDSLDIDGIYDIAYQNLQGDDYLTEKNGYGPTWEAYDTDLNDQSYMSRDGVYSPDGIIFEKDGTYGVMDFSGTVLIDGLAGNSYGAYNPAYDPDSSDNDPYSCTGWGISLEQDAVLGSDYTWQDYSSEIPDLLTEGDAGIEYVDQEGLLKAAIIGDPENPPMDIKDDWSVYTGEDAIVMRINDETSQVLGSARVNADGSVAYVTDYPLYDLDDARGYVNGFYVTSFYTGDFSIAREYGQEQDSSGYGLVNAENGELITKQPYQKVKWFEDGYCPVKMNDRWAFIDEQGNEITDFIFEDASVLYDGKTFVKLDGTYRILDLKATTGNGDVEVSDNDDTIDESDDQNIADTSTATEQSGVGWEDAYRQILESYMDSNESFYVADLDGGGIPELLLTDATSESYHGGRVEIYTFDGTDAVDLGQYGSWNSICVIQDQGVLLDTYLWEGGVGGTSYYQIDDSESEHIHFLFRVNQEIGEDGSFVQRMADKDGNDLPDAEENVDDVISSYSGTTVRYAVQDSLSNQDDPNAVIMMPVTKSNIIQTLGSDNDYSGQMTESTPEGDEENTGDTAAWQQAYWSFLMDTLYDLTADQDKAFCIDDMDGDGIPEIALADNNTAHYNGVTIYTWQNNQVLELGGFGGNGGCEICKDKGIIRGEHSGQGASITEYCQIDHSVPEGIKLLCRVDTYTSETGTVYDLVDADGNSIQSLTEDEYNSKIQEYESVGTFTEYSVPDSDGTNGYAEYYPDWVPLYELTYDSICDATGIYEDDNYFNEEDDPYALEENYE